MGSPNGGENWAIGSPQTLRWTSSNLSGNVKIELSRDGGTTFSETLFASTANDGSEPWTVTGPTTASARLRVSSLATPSINDTSNANFSIETVAVLYIHGMNSDPSTWARLVQERYENSCPILGSQIVNEPDPPSFATRNELCYRIRFDCHSRVGLEDVTCSLGSGNGDFATLTELGLEVCEAVEVIIERHPGASIILVGHSRGGLAARAFLQHPAPSEAKDRVVGLLTIGTPHLGSPLGRVYDYLQTNCLTMNGDRVEEGACEDDWEVVDFLRGERDCILFFREYRIDIRRPTISDLATASDAINTLNETVVNLPTNIVYGQLVFEGVPLGKLKIQGVDYNIFDRPIWPQICDQVSDAAEDAILLDQRLEIYAGDGIVPDDSQMMDNIPNFPVLRQRIIRLIHDDTVHKDETDRIEAIQNILGQMVKRIRTFAHQIVSTTTNR